MAEINLLDKYPHSKRPIEARGKRKLAGGGRLSKKMEFRNSIEVLLEQQMLNLARQFGQEYFDGDRLYGYGGYNYHPRFWTETVKRFRDFYKLKDDASILEVGCAKGFMMFDFKSLMPNSNIVGIDISQYAYDNSMDEMRKYMRVGNAKELPFPDKTFDLVISINTIDHLPLNDCKMALKEIQRVSKRDAFISVNAWTNEIEKEQLLKWNITAQTAMHVDDWRSLFNEVGYTGDYWWFIAK